jgi:hypothetical protein
MQDASVERIWEGTSNVLALDVARVVQQTKGSALISLKKVNCPFTRHCRIYLTSPCFQWGDAILTPGASLAAADAVEALRDGLALADRAASSLVQDNPDPRLSRKPLLP